MIFEGLVEIVFSFFPFFRAISPRGGSLLARVRLAPFSRLHFVIFATSSSLCAAL